MHTNCGTRKVALHKNLLRMADAAKERQVNGMLCISAKTAQDSISATQVKKHKQ